jgi:hypothetical protein
MGNTLNQLKPPQGAQLTRKEGSLKPKNIDKLDPTQRAWSDNVMRVLGLKSSSSQARVLSGAISAAQLVETNGTNQEKLSARQLRATVIAAGKPPWKDAGKAMAAGDAKVQLDLLSMPSDKRVLKPLDKDKAGIHQSFWIDRQDADGQERPSFLCKPTNTPTAQDLKDRLPVTRHRSRTVAARRAARWRGRRFPAAPHNCWRGRPASISACPKPMS